MYKLLLGLLCFFFASIVSACLTVNQESLSLTWTAYKTFAKTPVSGTFKSINWDLPKTGASIQNILQNSKATISHQSVSTGDDSRDRNLKNYFFKSISQDIKMSSQKFERGYLIVRMIIGEVGLDIPLKPTYKDQSVILNGTIDLIDFSLSQQLKELNRICRSLHEGKTWSDVALEVSATFKPCSN